jgi:hypothetical protein
MIEIRTDDDDCSISGKPGRATADWFERSVKAAFVGGGALIGLLMALLVLAVTGIGRSSTQPRVEPVAAVPEAEARPVVAQPAEAPVTANPAPADAPERPGTIAESDSAGRRWAESDSGSDPGAGSRTTADAADPLDRPAAPPPSAVGAAATAPAYSGPSTSMGSAGSYSSDGRVHVRGYYRKDGTYVRPHTRSYPRSRKK